MPISLILGLLLAQHAPPAPKPDTGAAAEPRENRRTEINLLGVSDSASGESRRNENVQFNLIDNNALKELNVRLGTTATIVGEFRPDHGYFGAEFGNPPSSPLHLDPQKPSSHHGSLHAAYGTSIFNARSFFQAGPVRPSHENHFGARFGAALPGDAYLGVEAGAQRIRGHVNGNILVPLAADPALRAVILRLLSAFPAELPNRTDINPRALNTNALQAINDDTATVRLERPFGAQRLMLRYSHTSQQVDAFQLLAGQNPDTTTRARAARATWSRQWSASTVADFSAGFDRLVSLLAPEPNTVGPSVSFAGVIQNLGPSSYIPIRRAQNRFRYAAGLRQTRGRHLWTAGGEITRRQMNGSESSSHRGYLYFRDDFGRDAMTNLRLGVPSRFSGAVGSRDRGFRHWEGQGFAGDDWKPRPGLSLQFGLRFEAVTRPVEVNGINVVPYDCDCNNLAPRFGFAGRMPGRWGVLRGAYGLHYGEILPVTFHQVRYNPPANQKFEIVTPELATVFQSLDVQPDPGARSTFIHVSPELTTPYSHQYNFSWEPLASPRWKLQLGYAGSRSHKLLYLWHTNRARPADGIPLTTATINQRRSDAAYFDVRRITNASRGYFDAGRVSLLLPGWRGFTVETAYWISKAIDLGAGYSNTGAGEDGKQGQSQAEFDIHRDTKGPSVFDQSHAFLVRAAWSTPPPASWGRARSWIGRWDLSVVTLAKTGTPFSVITGSDAPGFGNVDGDNGDRPHIIDPSALGSCVCNPDTSTERLPFSAFAFLRPGDPRGNIGSNTFRKDGVANVNASLARTWRLRREAKLSVRAESVNLLNTPQFAEPTRELTSPSFGAITNTLNDGRAFRFQMKLDF
ncbi:MAG: hypothetical protein ACRD44_08845 [Bryobacteraceae bacterium]